MKTVGIIFIVLAAINLIVCFIALAYGYTEAAGTRFGGVTMVGALGVFLMYMGDKKKKDKESKEKWEKGE